MQITIEIPGILINKLTNLGFPKEYHKSIIIYYINSTAFNQDYSQLNVDFDIFLENYKDDINEIIGK
jgi:hypothetical protein